MRRHPGFLHFGSFLFLFFAGAASIAAGGWTLLANLTVTDRFALGLPWLDWHVRIDPLSGFFLVLLGTLVVAISLYGPSYTREFARGKAAQPLPPLGVFTALFVLGMQMLLLADDALVFMIFWEMMSLSGYFLVVYQHQHAANRHAAFLYLLLAHVGALVILLSFGVLAAFGGGLTFDQMRAAKLTPLWATIAFACAFVGFGIKAGMVPLHVWLPDAHPVAPSHISALMSGAMIKMGIYGIVRVSYDLIGDVQWEWGVVVLIIGTASSLLGVLYALMQHDLKRLLAYHSIENIGIILMGLGLSMIFLGSGHKMLGTLGLVAALYHTLNHALFKGLLFLGAGAVLYRTHARDLDHMGGLIHRMPVTAFLFLVGCVAISALPPFNGFRFGVADLPDGVAGARAEKRSAAHDASNCGGAARTHRGACGRLLRQGLRHCVPRKTAHAPRCPRTRGAGRHAGRDGAAGDAVPAARRVPDHGDRSDGADHATAGARGAALGRRPGLVVADPDFASGRFVLGAFCRGRHRRGIRSWLPVPQAWRRSGAQSLRLGLRLRPAHAAHAVHLDRLQSADPARFRRGMEGRGAHRHARQRGTDSAGDEPALQLAHARLVVAQVLRSDRTPGARRGKSHRLHPDRQHPYLPEILLRDAARIPMDRQLTAWALAAAQALLFIAAAPLLAGWLQRVKCHMQNRAAPAVWQPYRDLAKLLRKKMVLAENASWLFRAVPYIVFGAMLLAAAVVPLVAVNLPTAAIADVIVLVGFFALARFFTALAGLDIGTAFGGMGASREMMVAALAEPAMLMAVFTLSMTATTTNLSVATEYILQAGLVLRPSFLFALLALAMVAVAESSRIPVDNPATHLELTMLHEAMILEYGGRHLALIEWASQIKLMIYSVLIVDFSFPGASPPDSAPWPWRSASWQWRQN